MFREGRLRVGDRIISINGVDVYSATLSVAQKILQECATHAVLTVEYDVSILGKDIQIPIPFLI